MTVRPLRRDYKDEKIPEKPAVSLFPEGGNLIGGIRQRVAFEARDGEGRQIASAHGSETKRDFGDYFEKAETKAVGRALAYAGYGTQYVGEELDEGERIVDSPVERSAPAEAPKTASPKQVELLARYYTGDKLGQLLAYNGVARLEDLPMSKASELIAAITKITERRSAQ